MTMASSHTYSTPCYDKDIIPCAFYTMLWQWHHPMFILQHVMTMTLPHVHSTTCNDTDVVPCLFYRNNRITHNRYFICSISHKMITQFRCALFCYAYTCFQWIHYNYAIMGVIASQITSLTSVYSTVCLGVDQRKHQSSASLALLRGIHRGPVNSPHKWPVTRKMLPFEDVIMSWEDSGMYQVEESNAFVRILENLYYQITIFHALWLVVLAPFGAVDWPLNPCMLVQIFGLPNMNELVCKFDTVDNSS